MVDQRHAINEAEKKWSGKDSEDPTPQTAEPVNLRLGNRRWEPDKTLTACPYQSDVSSLASCADFYAAGPFNVTESLTNLHVTSSVSCAAVYAAAPPNSITSLTNLHVSSLVSCATVYTAAPFHLRCYAAGHLFVLRSSIFCKERVARC